MSVPPGRNSWQNDRVLYAAHADGNEPICAAVVVRLQAIERARHTRIEMTAREGGRTSAFKADAQQRSVAVAA